MRQRNICGMALVIIVASLFCSSPSLAASRQQAMMGLNPQVVAANVMPLCQTLDVFTANESHVTYPGYVQYMGLMYFEAPFKSCFFTNHFINYIIRLKNAAGTYVPLAFNAQASIYYYLVDTYKPYAYILIIPGPPGTQPVKSCTFPLPSCALLNA